MGMYSWYSFEFYPFSDKAEEIIKHPIIEDFIFDGDYNSFHTKGSISNNDLEKISLLYPDIKIVLTRVYEEVLLDGSGLSITIAKNGKVKTFEAKATYEGKSPEELISSFE